MNTPLNSKNEESSVIPWILRIGVAGCFIGHGAFGIITKSAWLPYFAVAGIGESLAWPLMPIVGAMDIAIGILAIAWPSRALFLWAGLWATWTALLRPLSGEPVWEFLERAGNYGVPLAVLLIVGLSGGWFKRLAMDGSGINERTTDRLILALRLTTATLLAGHAGLGLFTQKAGLAHHYASLGFENASALVPYVGAGEFALVALAILFSRPSIFLGICIWKMATESLFIVAGAPFWEFIERFGSYAAPLAVAYLLWQRQTQKNTALKTAIA